jgi:PsbP
VLRFVDVGFNADVRIEELGPPDKIIAGFAPELFGAPLEQGDVTDTVVAKRGGLTYYTWVIKPLTGTSSTTYHLASATAYKNRVFIIAVAAKARAMRRVGGDLRAIVDSFRVKMD